LKCRYYSNQDLLSFIFSANADEDRSKLTDVCLRIDVTLVVDRLKKVHFLEFRNAQKFFGFDYFQDFALSSYDSVSLLIYVPNSKKIDSCLSFSIWQYVFIVDVNSNDQIIGFEIQDPDRHLVNFVNKI